MLDSLEFGNLKDLITQISRLIKQFTEMLKNFVASWKKVPAAANGTPTDA